MKDYQREYCERCHLHSTCGYIDRHLERKCSQLSDYSEGYEKGIVSAISKIEHCFTQSDDVDDVMSAYHDIQNVIKKLKSE